MIDLSLSDLKEVEVLKLTKYSVNQEEKEVFLKRE